MKLMYVFAVFLFLGCTLGEIHKTKSNLVDNTHQYTLEKRAVSSSSCLTSLYVMAFTSGLTGAGSDSTYQIRLQYGGSTRTLSFYDRPGDDLQSNKGDLWQFSLSGCITLSALSSVSIVAAGTDGWNIGSVVTLVGDSVGRIQVLTRNFNANFWIDTDSGFDRPFVLSLSLSGVNLGSCLSSLYIIAFTSGVSGGGSDAMPRYSAQLESNGAVRTVTLSDRPGDDYLSNKGDLWSISLSSFGFSDNCLTITEIQRVSITVSTVTDDWNIGSIVTLVSDSISNLAVLTRDFGVDRWVNSRMDLSFADINECTLNIDGCSHNCVNTIGSYTCSCRSGYQLGVDGHSCQDINECNLNTDGCAQTCINTAGSYTCSCNSGYRLASNGRSCNDINECTEGSDRCAQTCINNVGSYTCSCLSGYRLASDRLECTDINECSEGTERCAQTCINTVGSYICSCNSGYYLASDGLGCTDINECSENRDGCTQTCVNTVGSYMCSCNSGYRLASDRHGCTDINECAESTDSCAQTCINTAGNYTCSCNSGYRLASNGQTCNDINECTEGSDGCAQTCTNNNGSYTCSCNSGYRLASDRRGCTDINECVESTDSCAQNCTNTAGSYTCSCNSGYHLASNGRTCNDTESESITAAIVGGVAGCLLAVGFAIIGFVILLVILCLRRKGEGAMNGKAEPVDEDPDSLQLQQCTLKNDGDIQLKECSAYEKSPDIVVYI